MLTSTAVFQVFTKSHKNNNNNNNNKTKNKNKNNKNKNKRTNRTDLAHRTAQKWKNKKKWVNNKLWIFNVLQYVNWLQGLLQLLLKQYEGSLPTGNALLCFPSKYLLNYHTSCKMRPWKIRTKRACQQSSWKAPSLLN